MDEPQPVKVVLLGESSVGKTSIINQFTAKKFNVHCTTTVTAQFISKVLTFPEFGKSIQFNIWDTVGQEKYRSLAKIYYKDAKVIIFVYDITKKFSFDSIKDYWYKETNNNIDGHPLIALVANKVDLYENQQVDTKEGRAFADEINAIFQSTSAKNDSGINTLFENIGKKIIIPEYDYKNTDGKALQEYIKISQGRKNEKPENKEHNIKLKKKNTNEIKETNKRKCC